MNRLLARRSVRASDRAGIALLWAVFIVFVVTSAAFVSFSLSGTVNNMARTNARSSLADSLSYLASEQAIAVVESALDLGDEVPESGTLDTGIEGAVASYTIEQDGDATSGPDPDTTLDATYYYYRVLGTATIDGVTRTTRRIVRATMVSAFQFAIFLEDDLVIYNQADTYISGPVHTNGDMYLYTRNDLVLNTNYVRSAGNLYLSPKFSSWGTMTGLSDPSVRRWVEDPTSGFEMEEYEKVQHDSTFMGDDLNGDGDFTDSGEELPFAPYIAELTSEPDLYTGDSGQTVMTSEHGVSKLTLPSIADLSMFTPATGGDYEWDAGSETYVEVAAGTGTHAMGEYHAAADLRIISYEDGSWKAFDADGTDVSFSVSGAVKPSSIYDAYQSEDAGDDTRIQATIIDVDALNDSGVFPENGLLYMGGYGAGTGVDAKAFQLSNGKELKGDLTVVSPNSVYVHGDYNVDAKKNASVIADAVHVLSNAWGGDKGPGDLPEATDTTYNMSIATGSLPQKDREKGYFVTGNLLRRHELWTDKDEHFNGSLVSLGFSQYATGRMWASWDDNEARKTYRPPIRHWSFDQSLMLMSNQPPFAPTLVNMHEVITW